MKTFKVEFQVRGYELDGNAHVNHAVYLNYAEHARWSMLEDAGAGADYFKRNGVAPVIARAELEYKEPCFLAEWLIVETTLVELRTRTAKFRHRILKRDTGKLAADIHVLTLCVDTKGKAVTLPSDFGTLFSGN